MPTKNQAAVDDMLSKITTQINELEADVTEMEAEIDELSACTGTEENPHNHYAEIVILGQEVRLCEETISKLNLLKDEINTTSKTLDQIDNELSALLNELEDSREDTKCAKTSEMLMREIEYYEAEAKAYEEAGSSTVADYYRCTAIPALKAQY
ncbi:MAG: hypothetical protein WC900_06315, partial [Oscillospiraceae bacterium]